MAIDIDIRSFFRRAPRNWLHRYFAHHGILENFDWTSIGKIKIDALHNAWLGIESDLRERTAEDFRNLSLLATPAGKLAIIDEADHWKEETDVAARLGELEDFLACAFWAYLERPKYWDGAIFFAAADSKPKRYWRKRINIPRLGRETTDDDGKALGSAVGRLFMEREGRGAFCVVHQYRRGEREYYFAYPQDHPQTSMEYEKGGRWTKRPYSPAFEIIFVHNDSDKTLNIWHQGSGDRVKDLQVTFAQSVLGVEIPRTSPKDTRVYDLNDLVHRDFRFRLPQKLGILSAEIRRLRLHILAPFKHWILVDIGADTPRHVLYDRIETATRGIPASAIRVSQAGIRVRFEKKVDEKRQRTRRFEVTWPNSCSLQNEGYDIVIQHMLVENGIEPRQPPAEEDDDASEGR